jgi:tRNA(Ile)-lysidine synthetase-like protein
MDLLEGLRAFFAAAPLGRGDRLVVAFSGGGDSTALLWGLSRLAPGWGIEIVAAHLDHAMDGGPGGSAARAAQAGALARRLGVPMLSARREVAALRRAGESLEAAARRIRYRFLEEARRDCRARSVATAHHRDDQAETVLLRMRFGSGLRGLAAIRPIAGSVVRPLLGIPRATLRAAVAAAGLEPAEDPGNTDLRQPRSRMRHQVLPALAHRSHRAAPCEAGRGRHAAGDPATGAMPAAPSGDESAARHELSAALARLAACAQRALPALDLHLAAALGLTAAGIADAPAACLGLAGHAAREDAGGECDGDRLAALPPPLLPLALALLHARAGAAYPPSRGAAGELGRQLRAAGGSPARRAGGRRAGVGCDCGGGWTWRLDAGGEAPREARRVRLVQRVRRQGGDAGDGAAAAFTYTLEVPGELAIPEIGQTIRVRLVPVEDWMLQGAPHRAGLALPLGVGGRLTVRNRRPGDCIHPLGAPGRRKLKEVLIDRGIPRARRDRLPLLCWAGEIVWVPGVTIEHRFRLTGSSSTACLAELAAAAGPPGIPTRG